MKRRGRTEGQARKVGREVRSGRGAKPMSATLRAALYFIRKRRRLMAGTN
jgi:hypothetical protein